MFFFYLKYIVLIMVILLIVLVIISLIKKKKGKNFKYNSAMNVIIFPTVLYWLYIILTSQFLALRYILPAFVFILIILFYFIYLELTLAIENKKALVSCMLIFSILCIIPLNLNSRKIAYQYYENKYKYETIEKYKNIPVIYMYSGGNVLNNDFMFVYDYIRRFDKSYMMNSDRFSIYYFENVIKDVDVSNGVILVDYSALVDEKCNEIILNSNKFSSYENVLKLYEDKNPDIYISFCLLK